MPHISVGSFSSGLRVSFVAQRCIWGHPKLCIHSNTKSPAAHESGPYTIFASLHIRVVPFQATMVMFSMGIRE